MAVYHMLDLLLAFYLEKYQICLQEITSIMIIL